MDCHFFLLFSKKPVFGFINLFFSTVFLFSITLISTLIFIPSMDLGLICSSSSSSFLKLKQIIDLTLHLFFLLMLIFKAINFPLNVALLHLLNFCMLYFHLTHNFSFPLWFFFDQLIISNIWEFPRFLCVVSFLLNYIVIRKYTSYYFNPLKFI